MHSGNVSNNSATQFGGGVQTNGTFTMLGGTISNNTAALYGGGVLVPGSGVFNMSGGEITKNIATSGNGGGVYALYSDANISGGTISENKATTGGGIYVGSNRTVNISGDSYITNNTATGNGGGIYVTVNGTLNVTNTNYIENNIAGNDGGGIYTANTDYSNINTDARTKFNGNKASAAYAPPINASILYPNIGFASTSITVHPLNNYDINYKGTPLVFNVTYNANGGVGSYIGPDIKPGNTDTILLLSDTGIGRKGYMFTRWNTEADGSRTSYQEGDSIELNNNITLYAQWKVNQYTVNFESNGGSPVDSKIIVSGISVAKPNDPTRQGYIFEDWYADNEAFLNKWDFNTPITEDLTLYARWTEVAEEYTVSFESNGGSLVDSQIISEGSPATRPTNPTRQGYTFEGWHTDDGTFLNEWDFNTPVTENLTLYAKWTKDPNYKPCNCKCIWMLMFIILIILIVFFKKIMKFIKCTMCKIKRYIRYVICKLKCKCKKCKK